MAIYYTQKIFRINKIFWIQLLSTYYLRGKNFFINDVILKTFTNIIN